MNVYMVPSGPNRHELYCEIATPATAGDRGPATSLWQRMADVFHRVLAEGERAREAPDDVPKTSGRIRRFMARKLAEAVAEQRLLWHLRRETHVALIHPDDIPSAAAVEETRRLLTADREKHLRWMLIDGLLIVVSTPVALLPGPNVLAYYFIFRTVGHFLSMRGAQRGLSGITWDTQPSAPLADLRATLALDRDARRRRVDAIASTLGLDRLSRFVDEMAAS
jgi:Mitochondrial K+-H+ exchange-related